MEHDIPASLGFRMPAEWEPHEATWLSWPHELDTWPKEIREIEALFLHLIQEISQGEKIKLLVSDEREEEYVRGLLRQRGALSQVSFYRIKTASVWMRDYSPLFILNRKKEKALVRWKFNAWGEKYHNILNDAAVSAEITKQYANPLFSADMVLEGGSIDVNGAGILLTTEQCLLHSNRNPKLKRAQIERYVTDFLGISKIIWLKGGIAGDDTDGHVDDVARFVSEKTVAAAVQEDASDINFEVLRENLKRLQNAGSLEVVRMPMPGDLSKKDGQFPASYVNFYIANACVLMPIFQDRNDNAALGILKELFPKRKVIGIPSRLLVRGFGAIHCITREEPLGAD